MPPRAIVQTLESRLAASRSASSASRSATATTPARRPSSSCPTSPPAPTAWPRCSTRPTGATATPSPTAPTAARASASSRRCPTTGPTRPCAASPCARRASAEYENPLDRRFHAQPNACPVCGPRLALLDEGTKARRPDRQTTADRQPRHSSRLADDAALHRRGRGAARRPDRRGQGAGRLSSDGRCTATTRRSGGCASASPRRDKPFAVMARDLAQVRGVVRGPARSRGAADLARGADRAAAATSASDRDPRCADAVAPGNPYLGVMLPYTPLHHLLLRETGLPGRRHQRQPDRRADLHRRGRGAAAAGPHRRRRSWCTTGPSPATWTTAWRGSCAARRACCAGRAAMRRCRCC